MSTVRDMALPACLAGIFLLAALLRVHGGAACCGVSAVSSTRTGHLRLVAQAFPLALRRWFFQQLVLVFDFYHRLGLKNREVRPCMCRCDAHSGIHI